MERLVVTRAGLRAALAPAMSAEGARSQALPAGAGLAHAVLASWWHHHPWRRTALLASEALALLLMPEAKHHPVRMLAWAALAGGLLAASRPWRWLARPALMAIWPVLMVGIRQLLATVADTSPPPPDLSRVPPTTPRSSSGSAG